MWGPSVSPVCRRSRRGELRFGIVIRCLMTSPVKTPVSIGSFPGAAGGVYASGGRSSTRHESRTFPGWTPRHMINGVRDAGGRSGPADVQVTVEDELPQADIARIRERFVALARYSRNPP